MRDTTTMAAFTFVMAHIGFLRNHGVTMATATPALREEAIKVARAAENDLRLHEHIMLVNACESCASI